MLEMLHIHIPFQCFLRPGPCSEYLSLVVQDTGWAPSGPVCAGICIWDIYDIYSLPYFDTKWRRPDH